MLDGRKLNFHLAGINNQNFIMQDEETGSWWQQVTGEAIFGPLKGRRLEPVFHDELTFLTWKNEQPRGRVLKPNDDVAWRKFSEDWEAHTARMPVVVQSGQSDPLAPRTLVVGVKMNGYAKAYPFSTIERQSLIIDTLGGVSLMLVLGDDKKSVRAFETSVDGNGLEFFAKANAAPLRLVDSGTGSEWDFAGTAVAGKYAGRKLKRVPVLLDYWFDWKIYNPDTSVY